MGFRWDWLRPTIVVPYLPTIGPIHPQALAPQLFADITAIAGTGKFLDYDKDRRWFDIKSETVLVDEVAHRPHLTLVPSVSRRGTGKVTVYLYGTHPDGYDMAAELAAKLRALCCVERGQVVYFVGPADQPPADAQVVRVRLRPFGVYRPADAPRTVLRLDDCPPSVQETFPAFALSLAADGFAFLRACIERGGMGPVLVSVNERRVVGAIGPLEMMADSVGAARFLPPYFGVLPDHRRRGYGRALWRAAMQWGESNGAAYHLLQTAVGGPSDDLCRAEGLHSLGFVCATNI